MEIKDKVVVVTGGANGIGAALCRLFAAQSARVVVSDIDAAGANQVAKEIDGLSVPVDVCSEEDLNWLVIQTEEFYGPIDIFCSNAGILSPGGPDAPDASWEKSWGVNVMSHVYAARAVLPGMIERGSGYLLQIASAAGLLSEVGSASYTTTKHAAVGFAEWLHYTYATQGIKVSCVCPLGVRTNMLLNEEQAGAAVDYLTKGAITPEEVADAALEGIRNEQFLILPHPEVQTFYRNKATDHDRWLGSMQKLKQSIG